MVLVPTGYWMAIFVYKATIGVEFQNRFGLKRKENQVVSWTGIRQKWINALIKGLNLVE